jgi:hypothetical protein
MAQAILPQTYAPSSDVASGTKPSQIVWGRSGNDVVFGYQPSLLGLGIDQLDVLLGDYEISLLVDPYPRVWANTFILGDWRSPYYANGNPFIFGLNNIALLADFSPSKDFIQLYGQPADYSVVDLFGLASLLIYQQPLFPGLDFSLPDVVALIPGPVLDLYQDYIKYSGYTPADISNAQIQQIGTGGLEITDTITSDVNGNLYMMGTTTGDINGVNSGLRDIFINKYNANGGLLYSHQFGTTETDAVYSAITDTEGNLYMVGSSQGDLGGALVGINADAWIAKFDPYGNQLWLNKMLGNGYGSPAGSYGIDIDASGFLYVSGVADVPTPPDSLFPLSTDNFAAKYNSDGDQIWYQQLGKPNALDFDEAYNSAVDNSGNFYRAGFTTSDFAGTVASLYDGWLSKHDADGNLEWINQIGTNDYDWIWAVDTDSKGNVLVGGWTLGSFVVDQPNLGSYDAWLAKYSSDGSQLWLRQFGSSGDDEGFALEVDGDDNIFIAGFTDGQIAESLNNGGVDSWLTKFSSDGNEIWRKQFGSAGNDQAYDLSIAPNGIVYVAGITDGSLGASNSGSFDAFVASFESQYGTLLDFPPTDYDDATCHELDVFIDAPRFSTQITNEDSIRQQALNYFSQRLGIGMDQLLRDDLLKDSLSDMLVPYLPNLPPACLSLVYVVPAIPEDACLDSHVRIATIEITDDELDTNSIQLTGEDVDWLELIGTDVFVKKGARLNYENKDYLSFGIVVDDGSVGGSPYLLSDISVQLIDVNESPVALDLVTCCCLDDLFVIGEVATMSSLDPDAGNIFSYSLVSGNGSSDNSAFSIDGDQLKFAASPGFKSNGTYSIRLRTTDQDGLSFEREVALMISNRDEVREIRALNYTTSSGHSFTARVLPILGCFEGDVAINRLEMAPGFANQSEDLQIGQTGYDFRFNVNSSISGNVARAIVDIDPLLDGLQLSAGAIKKSFAYFAYDIPENGEVAVATPFTYDPIIKAGARFYDLDANGIADSAELQLVDGGYGDKDGIINGVIVDPSTLGVVSLNPLFTATANALTVVDPNDSSSPAAVLVRASFSAKASSVNQIGYVALNANEADSLTYELVRDRGTILLANLESSGVPNVAAMGFQRDFSLINGQKLVFFEVVDTTLDNLLANNSTLADFGSSFRTLDLTKTSDTAASASKGGNTVALSLLTESAFTGIDDLISCQMGEAPILDFTGLAGRTLEQSTVSLAREASYDSSIGFYRIQRADGAVLDPITNTLISPGSAGYKAAALSDTNLFNGFGPLAVSNGATRTDTIAAFNESGLLAPYATVAQTGDTFFSFSTANSDALNHFRVLGSGVIGLEDLAGGGDQDFDDIIVSFNFKLKQGTVA